MKRSIGNGLWLVLLLSGVGGTGWGNGAASRAAPYRIEVYMDQPGRCLAGGLGASWHAIRREVPFDPKRMTPGRSGAPQGSGFGGNPPLENAAAWQDLELDANRMREDFWQSFERWLAARR